MSEWMKWQRCAARLASLALVLGLLPGQAMGEAALEVPTQMPDSLVDELPEPTDAPATDAPLPEVTDAPSPLPSQEPTARPEPTDTPVQPVDEPTAPTDTPAPALSVRLSADVRSCFAGDTVRFFVTVEGEGASCTATVEQGGQALFSGAVEGEFAVEAASFSEVTELRAKVVCIGADGQTAEASCALPCALRVIEQPWEWEQSARIEKTGDWAQDLLAVARTQLGYRASEVNFIVDEQGNRQGYTRYGAWWRASYSGWCAMYVSFCLNYAGVPECRVPREANCQYWVRDLKEKGLYDDAADGEPEVGDLIFFDWDGRGSAGHMGIVSKVEDSKVMVIEGNHLKPVCEREYDLSLESICGYGRVSRACKIYREECLPDVDEALLAGGRGEITVEASLRTQARVGSARLGILEVGTPVEILAAVWVEDGRWYEVTCGEMRGFVRGDLVRIVELSAAPTGER